MSLFQWNGTLQYFEETYLTDAIRMQIMFILKKWCYNHIQKKLLTSRQTTEAQRHYKDIRSNTAATSIRSVLPAEAQWNSGGESWLAKAARAGSTTEGEERWEDHVWWATRRSAPKLCAEQLRTSPEHGNSPLCLSPWYWRSLNSTEGLRWG